MAFDNLGAKFRVCKKCAAQPIAPTGSSAVVSIMPVPELENYEDETSLERLVRKRLELEAGLRAMPSIPLDLDVLTEALL